MRIFSVSTRTCAIALIAAAAIGLTACGGGDGGLSRGEAEELQAQLDAAVAQAAADAAARAAAEAQAAADKAAREAAETQAAADRAARETAEAEAAAAKSAQAAAEAAQAAAEAQAQADVKAAQDAAAEDVAAAQAEADKAREAAQTAMAAADKAKEDLADAQAAQLRAERAKAEAERQLRLAQQDARTKEQERLAAEAEKERLMREAERQREAAEEAQQQLDAGAAQRALAGTRTTGTDATLAATPRYNAPALITMPSLSGAPSRSTAGRWLKTTLSSRTAAMRDMIEIYSDVEAPKREPFATSSYNAGNAVIDGTGMVTGHVDITNAAHSDVATSGAFPRTSGNPKPFSLVDRGLDETTYDGLSLPEDGTATDTQLENANITRQQYNLYRANRGFRDTDDFPQRYAYTTGGFLQGASGTYRCDGDATTDACTVQNRGASYHFVGDWDFIPSSGTVQILEDDDEYMWFGWWSRYTVSTDSWTFQAKHDGNALTDVGDVTGSATYRGTAAGHYAINEPVGGTSGLGSFTASAQLRANFDADSVSGSITGFSNDPGWSVTLNSRPIASGAVASAADSVIWTINGNPAANSGGWEAAFYSNLPAGQSTGVVPYGIAGTFQADYGSTAELIGAFGAHKQ